MIWRWFGTIGESYFLGPIFVILGGHRPMSPNILVQIGPFELKICQLPYFCMRNLKKVVPRRSVDPPDSNMGGFYRHWLLNLRPKMIFRDDKLIYTQTINYIYTVTELESVIWWQTVKLRTVNWNAYLNVTVRWTLDDLRVRPTSV